jgi:hypothetical protein
MVYKLLMQKKLLQHRLEIAISIFCGLMNSAFRAPLQFEKCLTGIGVIRGQITITAWRELIGDLYRISRFKGMD